MIEETIEEQGGEDLIVDGERLSLGVAARLSRYLQVLTQARKMGRETISSQELSEYTHINPTQIRRDLSGFGKFGKRGVGYNVESLVAEIRKILRTSGQHNIALFGAGKLGQAIASSDIFADHGFRIVAMFDVEPAVVGKEVGSLRVRDFGELESVVSEQEIVVGVLAVPADAAQAVADRLVEAGVKIIFNYSEQLLQVPPGGDRPHLQPGGRPSLRALLLPGLTMSAERAGIHICFPAPRVKREIRSMSALDLDLARERFEASTDFTVGLEEEFAIVNPETLELEHRFEDVYAACRRDEVLAEAAAGELIASEIEIRSGRGETFAEAVSAQQDRRNRLFALVEEMGLRLAATGTHPWADYLDQRIIDTPHYNRLKEELGWVAQRNNTWSLHVHMGIRGADRAIAVCDWLRELLPILLAASANSPVPRPSRQRPAHGAHGDLHPQLSSLRRAQPVRRLGHLRGLRRACSSGPGRRSSRPSSGGASAPPHLRHGRGEDLRRPDPRRGVDRPGGADRGLHRTDGALSTTSTATTAPVGRLPTARSRRTCGGRSATA